MRQTLHLAGQTILCDAVPPSNPGGSAAPGPAAPHVALAASEGSSLELSVVLPCLNEEQTLPVCIEKARRAMDQAGICGEIVVVDNGSTDRSVEIAQTAGARVVHQPRRGYGNALRLGFEAARGRYIIMADSDDSYDLADLGRFVQRLRGGAELVMGNRLRGEIKPGAMPWHHRWLGNPGLSWFLNLLFRTDVGDSHCGMRGFTRDAVGRINLRMPGMEMASEMVIKASVARLKIEEIPITLWPAGRNRRPHLRSFRDGWRHLRFMLMCSPVFLFLWPGLLLLLGGLLAIPAALAAGYGMYDNVFGPNFMYGASLLAITGANLIVFGVLAKLYAHQVDPVFADPRTRRWLAVFTVERGLVVSGGLLVTALLLAAPVLIEWWNHGTVSTPAQWILAGTLFALGLEGVFASFLLGILDLPNEAHRKG